MAKEKGFRFFGEVMSESYFESYGQEVAIAVNNALIESSVVTLNEVRGHLTRYGKPRGNSGKLPGVHVPPGVHLRDSFRATVWKLPYFGFLRLGKTAGFSVYSDNPNAVWQELGTRGRRSTHYKNDYTYEAGKRGKSAAVRSASAANSGVTALHYMSRGLATAYPTCLRLIQEAVAGAGVANAREPKIGTGSRSFTYRGSFAGSVLPPE